MHTFVVFFIFWTSLISGRNKSSKVFGNEDDAVVDGVLRDDLSSRQFQLLVSKARIHDHLASKQLQKELKQAFKHETVNQNEEDGETTTTIQPIIHDEDCKVLSTVQEPNEEEIDDYLKKHQTFSEFQQTYSGKMSSREVKRYLRNEMKQLYHA